MAKRKTNYQPFWRFLFVVYVALMVWLLFGRSYNWVDGLSYEQMLQQNINLQPLRTIQNYWYVVCRGPDAPLFAHCVLNLAGNVVMFVPAGWLLPRIFRRFQKFWRFALGSCIIIFLIESIQLFTLLGSFDVDDILLNLAGVLAGYLIWRLAGKK